MTAEYSLLPASTGERTEREAARGKQGGRTVEIQRLIGRALRGVVDFEALGERTVYLDCDVLQADGGTRCAAICGAYVAAQRALDRFGLSKALTGSVAAVSVGVVDGELAARPRLLGGLERRRRPERRHDRRRPVRRGAGDRRARPVRPRAARRAARSRRRGDRGARSVPAASADRRAPRLSVTRLAARSARRTRTSSTELREALPGLGARAARRRRAIPRRRRRPTYENAADQGAATAARVGARRTRGCSARTPGSSAPRSTARPGSTRRAGRRRRPGRRAARSGSRARPTPRAHGHRARRALARRRARSAARACSRDDRARARAATSGFGYDPIFVPPGDDAHGRRARRRLEARSTRTGRSRARALLAASDGCARAARHQLTSAPSTITFAITYSQTSSIAGPESVCSTGLCFEMRRTTGRTWKVASSDHRRGDRAGQHLAPASASAFVST